MSLVSVVSVISLCDVVVTVQWIVSRWVVRVPLQVSALVTMSIVSLDDVPVLMDSSYKTDSVVISLIYIV